MTKNGLYIGDPWEKFLAQRDRLPNWKIPLNLAVILHLAVFTGAAVLPDVGKKPEPDNVITIDLLSLPSVAPASVAVQEVAPRSTPQQGLTPQQPRAVQKKVVQKKEQEQQVEQQVEQVEQQVEQQVERVIEPSTPKVAVSPPALPVVVPKGISKSGPRPQAAAQVRPVSLRPIKRKQKLAEDIRLAEEKELGNREKQQEQKRLAALEKKRLAEQLKQEKIAEQKRQFAEQLKRKKIAQQKRQVAERERKLAAQKRRQQKAEEKKRLADQQRRKKEAAKAAHLARQAEQAAEQARLEAAQARMEYDTVAQAVSDLNTPLVSSGSGFISGGRGGSERGVYGAYAGERVNPAVLNQYAASLNTRISSRWQLPEIVKTKPHLRTMVALIVRRDGTIEDMRIERKSGDSFFDQSVIKALRSAAPLPGFPALISKQTLEFALNFTPQGLAM